MTGRVPQTLSIDLERCSYPIVIGAGLLDDADLVTGHVTARDVLVVTNETVGPLYAARLLAGLAGKRVRTLELPDGEQFSRHHLARLRALGVALGERIARGL